MAGLDAIPVSGYGMYSFCDALAVVGNLFLISTYRVPAMAENFAFVLVHDHVATFPS